MNLKAETIEKIEKSINKATLPETLPIKRGNKKIGKNTLIFNMSTAYNCESAKKGLCKVRDICYALKAEAQYNISAPKYRESQRLYYRLNSAHDIVLDILKKVQKEKIKTEYIRFNESGDFYDVEDVQKLKKIAELFKMTFSLYDIKIYGYTARYDLKDEIMKDKPDNLIINGSGFMLDNNFKVVDNTDNYIPESVCTGNCKECNLCKEIKGQHIYIQKH